MLSNRNLMRDAARGTGLPRNSDPGRRADLPVPVPLPAARRDGGTYCRLTARLAAGHYGVSFGEAIGRKRGSRRGTRARHVAMYLAHVVYGLNLVEVGAGFHRDRTTAAYACARIEDLRDDPAFDAALASLEISAGVLLELGLMEKAA